MESITLKDELKFSYQDGFEVIPEEERSKMNFLMNGPGVCLRNQEKHIIVSIGWKETDLILAVLVKAKDLVKRMEKDVRAAMKEYNYKLSEMKVTRIGGKKAYGFRYRYSVQGTAMTAESYVMQYKKTFYYFHVYVRGAQEKESFPVWEEILDSVSLTQ